MKRLLIFILLIFCIVSVWANRPAAATKEEPTVITIGNWQHVALERPEHLLLTQEEMREKTLNDLKCQELFGAMSDTEVAEGHPVILLLPLLAFLLSLHLEGPLKEPEQEPVEEPALMRFLSTGYSSAPEENGGFGAVDCKYGQPLPSNAVAADLSILPYGTIIRIKGYGEKVVVDTASTATVSKMQNAAKARDCVGWIDIYFGDDAQQASDWGVREVEIEVIKWGEGK